MERKYTYEKNNYIYTGIAKKIEILKFEFLL